MKILIIEDEVALAQSISEYLSGKNYLCEAAGTFGEAMSNAIINPINYVTLQKT